MNKHNFILLVILLFCTCQAFAQQKDTIHLDIQIENFTDSVVVMLGEKISGSAWHTRGIGEINPDGHFSRDIIVNRISDENHLALSLNLYGPGWDNKLHKFYAEPGGKVFVSIKDKHPETIRIEAESELNDTYNQFNKLTAKSTAFYDECKFKIDSLVNIRVETDEEYIPIEKALKEWRKKEKLAENEQMKEQLMALQKLPFNAVWKELLSDVTVYFSHGNYEEFYPLVEAALEALPFEEKSTPWYIDQLSLIHPGSVYAMNDVIDTELEDLDGNSYTLSQFRGKYVLLDFWGEGCMPCQASMPELSALSKKLEDKIVFISITQDYNNNDWRTATNRHSKEEFCWYNLRDKQGKGGLWSRNAVNSMPTFVLLSPEGKKIDQMAGYADGCIFDFLKSHLNLKSEATVTILNKSDNPVLKLLDMTEQNGFYQVVKKDTVIVNDQMEIKVPVNSISLFKLVSPGLGMIEFPIERDQHYSLSFNGKVFQLEGDEHSAQKLYTELYSYDSANEYAYAFSKYRTADSLLLAIDEVRQPMLDKVLQAHKTGKINTDMYTFIQHDIDCYWRTVMGINSNRQLDRDNDEEANKMWKMATEGISSDARIFSHSHSLYDFLQMKAYRLLYEDMESTIKLFGQNLRTTAFVNMYKKFLKDVRLENQYAHCLYDTMIQEKYEAELLTLFEDFKEMFPNSIYLPILESFIPDIRKFNNPQEYGEAIFVENKDGIHTLNDLLSCFKGQKLYVDIWATWCGPCKAEFKHVNELNKLLKEKGYTALYISLDQEENRENWMNMVNYYKLKGYHFMFPRVPQDIMDIFDSGIMIPREIIVSKNGEIINDDAARPSNLEELARQLK